jgi:hypothetical protein
VAISERRAASDKRLYQVEPCHGETASNEVSRVVGRESRGKVYGSPESGQTS